ncbi:uncharacterized protein BcabD6B2_23300 [Babesia caballi]|uniref:Uncharacterized protein n=1 Tax=Babesia caballi TaxID=5871 RepID=A0AAV4LTG4_BABCB|nr:hypothetical protein BcabD6B2_23300 [Babesia caballi]
MEPFTVVEVVIWIALVSLGYPGLILRNVLRFYWWFNGLSDVERKAHPNAVSVLHIVFLTDVVQSMLFPTIVDMCHFVIFNDRVFCAAQLDHGGASSGSSSWRGPGVGSVVLPNGAIFPPSAEICVRAADAARAVLHAGAADEQHVPPRPVARNLLRHLLVPSDRSVQHARLVGGKASDRELPDAVLGGGQAGQRHRAGDADHGVDLGRHQLRPLQRAVPTEKLRNRIYGRDRAFLGAGDVHFRTHQSERKDAARRTGGARLARPTTGGREARAGKFTLGAGKRGV